jgi:4,5-DOPA dioxygenase extradiol
MSRAPALFVSHGSPMFALEPGLLGPALRRIGAALTNLVAIVVVSPHWATRGVRVTGAGAPATIRDFGGFPAPLYALEYPARGAPLLASEIAARLRAAGHEAEVDGQRGLDHGAWVPLRYLRPEADVPVLQVSQPHDLDADGALRLGRSLAPLRDEGVLVVGSGSLTHNLREFARTVDDADYAETFARWVADAVARRDDEALVRYRERAPHAARAHPTEEHYLPLLVALGASNTDDARHVVEGGMTYGVLSMDSFGFGLPSAAVAEAA